MNAAAIASLLGLTSTDPRVEETLQQFAVLRRPALELDSAGIDGLVSKSQDRVSNLSVGIEFGFQEESALMGLDEADFSVGPLLLSEIYFYGQRLGVREYPQDLPLGLALSDNRETVRHKLAWLEDTRRSYVRDTWEHGAFRLTVSYADLDQRIDFVLCMLRAESFEAFEGGVSRLPGVDAMTALLSRPMDDPVVRQALVPLGLDRQVLTGGSERAIDFRRTYGFKLILRPAVTPGKPKTMVLREIEYQREGEFGSRGWRGELPFDIEFDDSPETMIRKVGQEPTNRDDQDFSGQAYWELPDCALLVGYSTMENFVLRVCTMLPATEAAVA